MWLSMREEQAGQRKPPEISCQSCRRRKVRCDRKRPQCQACEQAGLQCEYPLHSLKPGPKLGSFQRQKRKCRERRTRTRLQSQPESAESPGIASQNGGGTNKDSHSLTDAERGSPRVDLGQQWSSQLQDNNESRININNLSFILHPSHEAAMAGKESSGWSAEHREQQLLVDQACDAIGQSRDFVEEMIRLYFENMVAINLFHKPSFGNKIAGIICQIHISALLAAMLGYATRFYLTQSSHTLQDESHPVSTKYSPEHFLNMAVKFIDESLAECDDEPPPICVVQALIITTHCQLTRGVHGKAWRSLGTCVRLAYELNLHLIDACPNSRTHQRDPVQWRDDEEKRRAWWAIWEMDVFASTIRRTPTALDWAHMETLLPVDDADWNSDRPAPSSFLARDPIQRWKTIEATGNHSPKAWFLVVNSLMKDAQLISDPRSISSEPEPIQIPGSPKKEVSSRGPIIVEDARQRLEMLANAVQCFVLALPQHLRYTGHYLSFDPPAPPQVVSMRQLHCGIYNIFAMTQLARLMIHRYELFRQPACARQSTTKENPGGSSSPAYLDMDNLAIRQYFEAADNILTIVNRSSEHHIKYINPFLLSTIWLACAVQLVRKYLGSAWINPSLIKSRYDVLYLTYKRCVSFWDAKTALQENLECLELQLETHFQAAKDQRPRKSWARESSAQGHMNYPPCISDHSNSGQHATNRPSSETDNTNIPCPSPNEKHAQCSADGQDRQTPSKTPSFVEWKEWEDNHTLPDGTLNPPSDSDGQLDNIPKSQHQHQQQPRFVPTNCEPRLPLSPAASQNTKEDTNETSQAYIDFSQMSHSSVLNPPIVATTQPQSVDMQAVGQDNLEWWPLDLPMDLKDFLSGTPTY